MSLGIYCRLLGQAAALTMHGVNAVVMLISMQDEKLMRDPEINQMVSMQGKYITVWNIAFQMSYFALAFACDILTVMNKDHIIPKSLRNFRQIYFATLIWPVATLIVIIFWPFFLTNRELLFPAFIDKIFSFKSNLVMHLGILPAALWELTFLLRPVPKSHAKNITILTSMFIIYVAFIMYVYSQRGLWPYPIFKIVYGTIYFPLFLVAIYFLTLYLYRVQWRFTSLAGSDDKKYVKKNKI